jgi:hypothetical protein
MLNTPTAFVSLEIPLLRLDLLAAAVADARIFVPHAPLHLSYRYVYDSDGMNASLV